MSDNQEIENFHPVSKLIHWTTAIIIIGLLSVGFYMGSMEASPAKFQIFSLHKSFGLLVLLLGVLRIVWHKFSRKPRALPTHKPWEKFLSHAAHAFLYFAIIAIPLSGWIMSSAGDFPNVFFGLFDMPDLVAKNEEIFRSSREAHEILAVILILVLGMHILGAFKHHFIDRDETLERMTKRKLGFSGGAVLLVLVGAAMAYPTIHLLTDILGEEEEAGEYAQAEDGDTTSEEAGTEKTGWIIDQEKSSLKFEATQSDQGFGGTFKKFDGEIVFDPQNLGSAYAKIIIDISSLSTGSADRDAQAVSPDWFATEKFPQAIFQSESFEQGDVPNKYVVKGKLTLRDITLPITFPFTLDITSEEQGLMSAVMQAHVSLNRLDFGIGQGQWKATDVIGDQVNLQISLSATMKK